MAASWANNLQIMQLEPNKVHHLFAKALPLIAVGADLLREFELIGFLLTAVPRNRR